MKQLTDEFKVETLCSVLEVSRTAYYRYLKGTSYQLTAEKKNKQQLVEQIFVEHKRRYGSRRITAELKEQGYSIGRHQVRKLMERSGLQAIQPKAFVPRTTDSAHGKGYWPNLLLDQPLPKAPDLVWVSDITYLPLIDGKWAYLAVWMDLYSRKIVGWQVSKTMEPGRWSGSISHIAATSCFTVSSACRGLNHAFRPRWSIYIYGIEELNKFMAH